MPENPQTSIHPRGPRVHLPPIGYVTEAELARRIGKHPRTMLGWRMRAYCPPYLKVGYSIFYREDAIEAWLKSLEVDPAAPPKGSD